MIRKTKVVTIGDDRFEVKEASVGIMMPLLPQFSSGDSASSTEAQLELMKQCVFINGVPLGEGIIDLGMSVYMKLAETVMEVNGMQEEPGKVV